MRLLCFSHACKQDARRVSQKKNHKNGNDPELPCACVCVRIIKKTVDSSSPFDEQQQNSNERQKSPILLKPIKLHKCLSCHPMFVGVIIADPQNIKSNGRYHNKRADLFDKKQYHFRCAFFFFFFSSSMLAYKSGT